jgi:hypothetical protein
MKLFAAVMYMVVAVVILVWFIRHVYRTFGWAGLALKSALFIDGIFIALIILHFNEDNWNAVVELGFIWSCLFYLDPPMRWLGKRPIKWVIYGIAVLSYAAIFAAEKGWISHGPL